MTHPYRIFDPLLSDAEAHELVAAGRDESQAAARRGSFLAANFHRHHRRAL